MKWTQEGYLVVISQDVKILPGERGSVERFIAYHNADIDALTADRDELQRRLDDVVALINQHAPKVHVYTKYEGAGTSIRVKEERLHARAVAIAEGRTP